MPHFGYLIPTRDVAARGSHDTAELFELGLRAESAGFDSLWVGDSPMARPRADGLSLLAALAVCTSTAKLGTAVLLPALRHPILLAHQLATIDSLAAGRLIVGVGSGFPYPPTRAQFAAVDVPFGSRVSRLREAVAAMREVWAAAGEAVSFAGVHFAFEEVAVHPQPATAGGPPIWMAGAGPTSQALVGAEGDGWLPYPPTVEQYREGLHRVAEAADAAGRPRPTPALYATVAVERAGVPAAYRLQRSVERYYDAPLEMLQGIQALFAGSASAIAEWMMEYIEAGAEHIVVRIADDDAWGALEVLGSEVLPALAAMQEVGA